MYNSMGFLKKIRGLPLITRKIILWLVVTITAVCLFALLVKNTSRRLNGFSGGTFLKNLNFPTSFNGEIKKFQEIKGLETKNLENLPALKH